MDRRVIITIAALQTAVLGFAGSTDAVRAGGGDECIFCMQDCSDLADIMLACSELCGSQDGMCDDHAVDCEWDIDDEDEQLFCNGGVN